MRGASCVYGFNHRSAAGPSRPNRLTSSGSCRLGFFIFNQLAYVRVRYFSFLVAPFSKPHFRSERALLAHSEKANNEGVHRVRKKNREAFESDIFLFSSPLSQNLTFARRGPCSLTRRRQIMRGCIESGKKTGRRFNADTETSSRLADLVRPSLSPIVSPAPLDPKNLG